MNLDIKYLCRSEATARLVSVGLPQWGDPWHLNFETSDGFKFQVPMDDLRGCLIEAEPVKAIQYMKWIKRAVASL